VNITDTFDPVTGIGNSVISSAFNVMTDPMTGMTDYAYDMQLMNAVHKPMRPEDIQMGLMFQSGVYMIIHQQE